MIYLTEPVDEYCIQALPEFDGKRFQNVAKEGVKFEESEKSKESREALEKEFEPLLNWMKDKALKDKVKYCVTCHDYFTCCTCYNILGRLFEHRLDSSFSAFMGKPLWIIPLFRKTMSSNVILDIFQKFLN